MFILFHLTRFKLETIESDTFQTRVQLFNRQLGVVPWSIDSAASQGQILWCVSTRAKNLTLPIIFIQYSKSNKHHPGVAGDSDISGGEGGGYLTAGICCYRIFIFIFRKKIYSFMYHDTANQKNQKTPTNVGKITLKLHSVKTNNYTFLLIQYIHQS